MTPRLPPTGAAVVVTVVGLLPVYLLGGLAVQVRADLGLQRSGVGALVAAFFAGAAVGSLVGGRTADRLGAQRVMRLAVGAGALALLGAATASGPLVLGAALAVAGVASGAGQPASNALLARAVARDRRATAYGAKQAAVPAGVLLGGLAVPVFGVTVGWRWAYVAAGLAALLVPVLVPAARDVPDDGPTRRRSSSRERAADAAGAYRLPPLLVLAVGATLGAAVGNAFGAFFVETAVDTGLGPGPAGLTAAFASALGVLSRLGVGALADRRDGRWLLVVAAMMLAGAPACALLALGAQWALLPAVVLAYGLGWAWAGLLTHAVTLLHPDAPGRATGVTQAGISAGGALGPLAFGQLADAASLRAAWTVTAGAALLAAVAVLAGRGLLLRDRPRLAAAVRPARSRSRARSRRAGTPPP